MTGDHAELVAELRALAETALDRLGPILEKAAAGQNGAEAGAGGSSCSWCPLCAVAALVRGEQHDLVTLVAAQGSVFLAALREVLDTREAGADAPADPASPDHPVTDPPGAGSSFVPIAVTVKSRDGGRAGAVKK